MSRKQTKRKTIHRTLGHHAKRILVPHKANQFRPHLVRLHGITAVLVIALLMQVVYGYFTSGRLEVLGRVSDISTQDLVDDTNKERAEASLPALTLNDSLNQAAYMKAKHMFAENYWAHVSPSGVTPWKWLADVDYNYSIAGENLAKNYPTSQATVDAWMASAGHRANILNDKYKNVGFAIVDGTLDGRPTTLVVAFYGAPVTVAVSGSTDNAPIEYAAPINEGVTNPLAYFGSALQSLSPATLGGLALLTIVGIVAVAAHHNRQKLPVAWRRSWRQHHGMYTMVGVIVLVGIIVLATGGGQI